MNSKMIELYEATRAKEQLAELLDSDEIESHHFERLARNHGLDFDIVDFGYQTSVDDWRIESVEWCIFSGKDIIYRNASEKIWNI